MKTPLIAAADWTCSLLVGLDANPSSSDCWDAFLLMMAVVPLLDGILIL